jgi:phytanoyl-CoA hydroxylase
MIDGALTLQSDALERDGYLVLPGFFSNEQIDEVEAAVRCACSERAMEIVIDDLVTGERTFYGLAADRERGWFKLNDLYLVVDEVRALALEERLSESLRALLHGQSPALCNTLTLAKGSNQPMHIDSLFMTPPRPQQLVASWIAFEDVQPEAGPLEYYPGSHKIPLYRFRDGSHHAAVDELPQWTEYIFNEVKARELKKETFFARRGDVFIWHADLLHGGAKIRDPQKTRRSLVCHYFVESDVRAFPDWNLVPMNAGFWIDRLPQSVRAGPERFDEAHPFPEKTYLRRHPDVRAAVAEGRIPSAFAHYREHGFAEGRGV